MSKNKNRRQHSDDRSSVSGFDIRIEDLASLMRNSAMKIVAADIDAALELAALICGAQAELLETERQAGYQEWYTSAEKLENPKLRKKLPKDVRRIVRFSKHIGGFLFFVCLPRQLYTNMSAEQQSMCLAVLFTMLFDTPENAIAKVFSTEADQFSIDQLEE